MRIAVVNESSTKNRNKDIIEALASPSLLKYGFEILNLGMRDVDGEPDLTYIETGLISALALNLGAADFVIGGCGTGQGFLNAVMQFPNVSCGLIYDPLEAWLFSQVNAGNCVSLPLNKGYGALGGSLNLVYTFEKLFCDEPGAGYPKARAQIQAGARERLRGISFCAHLSMTEIIRKIDSQTLYNIMLFPGFDKAVRQTPDSELKKMCIDIQSEAENRCGLQ